MSAGPVDDHPNPTMAALAPSVTSITRAAVWCWVFGSAPGWIKRRETWLP